jgi:hypothetical protein
LWTIKKDIQMRLIIISAAFLLLTACGSEQSDSSNVDSSDSQSFSGSSSKSLPPALTNTPISFSEALGETSKIIEVEPCPFISDETIKASVRTEFEIIRRAVSNTQCRWSYNAGFAIEVTIEDILTAKPVSERGYNIDVATVKEPQDGPGTNALVLNDTAWDKPIPFAYSFEKDEKLVFIRYTGFKTNPEIMRPAANEVAARMSNAPIVDAQNRHATQPFKACDVWADQDIKLAFGAGEAAVIAPGANGLSTCAWTLYEDGASSKRTVSYKIQKSEPGKKAEYEYDSYAQYSAHGETHYLRKDESDFGVFVHVITPRPQGFVWVTVSDSENDPSTVAKALHKNLLDRMIP